MAIVKKVFESLNLDDGRFRLTWISASEGQKFAQVSTEFTEMIQSKGENPTKKRIFL